jgi:wyosine [tRNA(Phe)-imidazoG37] synthetase (radical SAM superfamily)
MKLKKELLIKRKEDKMKAEKEYNVLKTTLASNINIDDTEKQEILNNMDELKKKFVYIKNSITFV